MRTVLRHAARDARMFRLMLAFWLALVVALHVLVLVGTAERPAGVAATGGTATTFVTLVMLSVVTFAVIPALIVQEDPAVGTSAFWFTRPISRRAVVGAKLLVTVAAFAVVPVLADVVTMVIAGVPARAAFGVVPGALELQLAWLLPVVALAAITTTLGHFVLAALLEIVGYIALTSATRLANAAVFDASWNTVVEVTLMALIALGAALLMLGYAWRDQKRSYVAAGIAPAMLLGVLVVWPWDFAGWSPGPTVSSPVQASVTQNSVSSTPVAGGDIAVRSELMLREVPAGHDIDANVADAWLQDGSHRIAVHGSIAPSRTMRPPGDSKVRTWLTLVVPSEAVQRLSNRPVTLHAGINLGESVLTEAVVQPVVVGARYQFTAGSGVIIEMGVNRSAVSMTIRETLLNPAFRARASSLTSSRYSRYRLRIAGREDERFTGNEMMTQPMLWWSMPSMLFPVSQHLMAFWRSLRFVPPAQFNAPTDADVRAMLAKAQFVVTEPRAVASFFRLVTIPDVVLSVPAAPVAPQKD